MKIILSRKGFDSSNGGVPSPILPDGRMVSLPIPSKSDANRMGELWVDDINLGEVAGHLTSQRIGPQNVVHLDPDLRRELRPRPIGWRPAFGQTGASQTHLANNRVGVGDVFLFFGWFRRVEMGLSGYRFVRAAPSMHVIYGWLQVAEVWPIVSRRSELLAAHPAQEIHPHLATPEKYTDPRNTLYIAEELLEVAGARYRDLPGAGMFPAYDDKLCLTAPGLSRRHWSLPKWFFPSEGRPPLSHHPSAASWTKRSDHVELKSAAIGQEFVLDCDFYPEAASWMLDLLDAKP